MRAPVQAIRPASRKAPGPFQPVAGARNQRGSWTLTKDIVTVVATAATIIPFLVPDLSTLVRVTVTVGIVVCAAVLLLARSPRRSLLLLATLEVAVISVFFVVRQGLEPSVEERIVDAYFAQTRDANIWAGKPAMFSASSKYMLREFAAFDPRTWHGPDVLPAAVPASVRQLADLPSQYAGQGVVTVASVGTWNSIGGGEWVVQLVDLASAQTPALLARGVGVEQGLSRVQVQALFADAVADPSKSGRELYCRITLPPFAHPDENEVWVVRGTALAYGRVYQKDGTQSDVGYLACSHASRYTFPDLVAKG